MLERNGIWREKEGDRKRNEEFRGKEKEEKNWAKKKNKARKKRKQESTIFQKLNENYKLKCLCLRAHNK